MSTTIPTNTIPAPIKAASLSGYRRKKVLIYVVPDDYATTIQSSAWDGGSRTFTAFYDAASNTSVNVPSVYLPGGFSQGFRPSEIKFPYTTEQRTLYCVETGTFRSKQAMACLTFTQTHFDILCKQYPAFAEAMQQGV